MRAGDLKDRVVLQRPDIGYDSIGQPVTGWVFVARLWADVRYLPGLTVIKAGAETSMTRASVRLRRRAIDASCRVLHEGRVLSIEAIQPDPDRVYVDLVCEVSNVNTNG